MASSIPIKISKLKAPDKDTLKEMIRIYQEAYKHDETIQLTHSLPSLIDCMDKIITLRCNQPVWDFLVARTESSNQIVGWIALAIKLHKHQQLSEENVLFTQYALVPDIAAKCRIEGIDIVKVKEIAHGVLSDFKSAREKTLPDKHCIISTLVVDPEHQHKGVASALLSKAISRSEVFCFPMWVQTPSSYQTLFSKHLFEEVDEYQLDLNSHVPEPEDKGKTKAVSTLPIHSLKFMLRKEPLEKALKAYKSSTVFAEEEEERRRLKKLKEQEKLGSKSSAKGKTVPKASDLLLGGDVQTAMGEDQGAREDGEEAGPSTPLLKKSKKKAKKIDLRVQAVKNAAKEAKSA